jgi:multidrug resistance efflux pump
MIDVFAWIVLLILVASAIAIFFIAGALPGHIAKSRGHPWATAVTVAGWVTLICGFALWPLADLGLCRHSRGTQNGGAEMIVALFNVYLVILFILVKMKIVPFNLFWKVSPLLVLLLLMFGLFIPMGSPQGPALVVRNSVAVVPNVAGEVTDVPVEPNKPLRAGDVLFKIDPVPYQAQVDTIGAQVKFEELRLSQMTQLQLSDTGRAFDVEQRQADVDKLKGQYLGAKYNLEQTVVRAPSDGYVTNLGLIKGARVASLPLSPVMAFIDTSETVVGVEIAQIYTHYIEPGQEVEVTFKIFPGQVYKGKVDTVLQATSTGQVLASGTAVTPRQVTAAPFVVRVKLDDPKLAARLPAGTAGDAAIYTSHIKPSHIIRKVILRQIAIVNYVNPL